MPRLGKQGVSPGQVSLLGGQAELAYRQGQLLQAEALCQDILRVSKDNSEASYMLARIALDLGDIAKASARLGKAMVLSRADYRLWLLQGTLYARMAKLEEAQKAFTRVTRLAPMEGLGWRNLANVLLERGQYGESEMAAKTAAGLMPGNPDAHNVLAQALLGQEKFAEAEQLLLGLFGRFPQHGGILKNLCAVYVLQNKVAEVQQLIAGIDIGQADAESLKAITGILRKMGELTLADQIIEHAYQAYPQDLSWKVAYADIAFARGQYALGWQCYEARETDLPQTKWPQNLEGQEIRVYSDQGLGDDVFFWRYLPVLHERGAQVSYSVAPKLLEMAGRLPCVDAVTVMRPDMAAPEGAIPISSIPFLTGQGLVEHYPEEARLVPLSSRVVQVRSRLEKSGAGPYLGLTLRGGRPLAEVSGLRKLQIYSKVIGLDELAEVLKEWPGQIIWLQFKPQPGEFERVQEVTGKPVLDMSLLNDDLESMLALLNELDDYLAVSNTNVHLRAMLGKPSRVLVPMPPEFRWGRTGGEVVWFPGTRVYRQSPGGSWGEAVKQLTDALRRSISGYEVA